MVPQTADKNGDFLKFSKMKFCEVLFLLFILLLMLQKVLLATTMDTTVSVDIFSYPKHVSATFRHYFNGDAKYAILSKNGKIS